MVLRGLRQRLRWREVEAEVNCDIEDDEDWDTDGEIDDEEPRAMKEILVTRLRMMKIGTKRARLKVMKMQKQTQRG